MFKEEYEEGKYTQAKKRSVYFPKNKRHIFEQANKMGSAINGRSFDETVQDALELWIDRNWGAYNRGLRNE